MRYRRLLLFALYTALFLGIFLWWDGSREIAREEGAEPAAQRELALPSETELVAPEEALRAAAQRAERSTATEHAVHGPPLPAAIPEGSFGPPAPLATIAGRCVDPEGAPLRGAALSLRAETERGARFEELRQRSARDGRFRFEFAPQQLRRIELRARGPSGEDQVFRWDFLQGGREVELGDLQLGGGAALRFRVVDGEGQAVAARWTIEVRTNGFGIAHGSDLRSVEYVREQPFSEGTFAGLPPGEADVQLIHRALAFHARGKVRLEEDATAEVELVAPLRDLDGLLQLTIVYPHAPGARQGRETTVWLEAPGGARIDAQRGTFRSYEFRGLAPVPHTLHVEHPSYAPLVRPEVFPGQSIQVELRGSASLRLDVRDAASGERVSSYGLELRYAMPQRTQRAPVHRHRAEEVPPEDGRFDGIVPGEILAVVSSPEHESSSIDLGSVLPEEERRVEVRLSRGASIRGVVRDAEGRPTGGCRLLCGPRLEGERDARRLFRESLEAPTWVQRRAATSDESGRFELAHLSAGEHWVIAMGPEGLNAELICVLSAGVATEIELALPGAARLRGRLVGEVELPSDVMIRLVELGLPADHPRAREDAPSARLGSERQFELYPLSAGNHRVELLLPTGFAIHGRQVHAGERVALELGRVELATGTTVEQSFDLGVLACARLELELALSGLESVQGSVVLRSEPSSERSSSISASLGEDRIARFPVVPPGSYSVELSLQGLSLSYHHPTRIELAGGAVRRERWELRASTGRIRIVEAATRRALPNTHVNLGASDGIFLMHATGERGEIELTLLPGSYDLAIPAREIGAQPMRHATLEWTESGPRASELAF